MIGSLTRCSSLLIAVASLLSVAASDRLVAQETTRLEGSEGTSFWLAFPMNFRNYTEQYYSKERTYSEPVFLKLAITSSVRTSGAISAPGLGYRKEFTVEPNETSFILLDSMLQLDITEGISSKGIHITSDDPITVIATSHRFQTTGSFLILPESALGTDHRLVGYNWLDKDLLSQGAIVATEDGTVVTIRPSVKTMNGYPAGREMIQQLNKGDVYVIRPLFQSNSSCDLTGSSVTSTKPVAVFSGHNCAYVPERTFKACNLLVEQVPPVDTWGTEFVIGRLGARSGYSIRVLAGDDSTVISQNGVVVGVLNAGEFLEHRFTNKSTVLRTTKPVFVAQFSHGYSAPNPITNRPDSIGDPMMVFVQPVANYGFAYRFTAPFEGSWKNYATILARIGDHEEIAIGGEKISPKIFRRIAGTDYVIAHILVVPGTHTVVSTHPIGMVCYGFGYDRHIYDAYGNGCAMLANGAEKELPVELTKEYEEAIEVMTEDGETFKGEVWESVKMPEPDLESRE